MAGLQCLTCSKGAKTAPRSPESWLPPESVEPIFSLACIFSWKWTGFNSWNLKNTANKLEHKSAIIIQMRKQSGSLKTLTLSIWASRPSCELCLVVSLTNSLACEANCSSREVWLPCRPAEPKLEARASTLVKLDCLWGGDWCAATCQAAQSTTSTYAWVGVIF